MRGQANRQRRPARRIESKAPEPPPSSGQSQPPRAGSWLYGRHTVAAALANPERRWHRLAVLAAQEAEAAALVVAAAARRVGQDAAVAVLDRTALERLLPEGAVHQGWALRVEPLEEADLDDLLRAAELRAGRRIIVVLDQVSDPHNAGAILRSAAAFGTAGVVLGGHAAPPPTGTMAKAASGALDRVTLARAGNLARALHRLKEAGFWCVGLDEEAPAALSALDLGPRVALVLGSEGGGLRRLVRERCDFLARLPTRPEMPSLNVSNAAAIALYELMRAEEGSKG